MNIALLRVEFHLAGCNSLKEKRSRLASLKGKLGKQTNIAMCETGYQDHKRRAEWAFVVISSNTGGLDRAIDDVETSLQQLDAVVTDIQRESL